MLSIDSVLAEDMETGASARLRIETLSTIVSAEDASGARGIPIHHYSKEEWSVAQKRFEALRPVIEHPIRSRSEVEKLATAAGVHVATYYKWLAAYHDAGHVAALVPRKRGAAKGQKHLAADQELVISSVVEDMYLKKQRHSPKEVVDEVLLRCKRAKITAPAPSTIRRRLKELSPAMTLRRRGFKDKARDVYEPIRGSFPGADFPLAVVQIDHTPLDVIVLDEVHRKPIGRPWLTLAIDVYSRMIVGLYVTLDKPSATSVAMCISHAMTPKSEYLGALGVEGNWPVWGQIGTLHADNAREFKCKAVTRGCQANQIDMQWRPVKKPHYGAHIERYMGVVATELKKVPGTTFSNIQQRKGYDSEKEAVCTMKEVEAYLVEFIVNNYHQRSHSQLQDASPARVWQQGIVGTSERPGIGAMPIVGDPERIRMDFLPYFEITIQRSGVRLENVFYYDPVLDPYIGATMPDDPNAKRKFIFARDPRDVSQIYFLDPQADRYTPIPYRDLSHPPVSASELREVTKALRAENKGEVDEHRIFSSIQRNRDRINASTESTKAARRQAASRPKAKQAPAQVPGRVPAAAQSPASERAAEPALSIFDQELEVFEVGELN
ncbi:Mu transposase C-terminal domain-containing protein [Stenotrophomonas chelatiphaga]|uniref:Mu transposase C-terminal domain-containing protein n=1 Tax=Stenotrophomonas chelatiphaga TaxID=517011 RepID=UPI0028A2CA61|nr:Mu transposase C-terminal domain-containing protein [Stenotrophomonas chelatiphaga]